MTKFTLQLLRLLVVVKTEQAAYDLSATSCNSCFAIDFGMLWPLTFSRLAQGGAGKESRVHVHRDDSSSSFWRFLLSGSATNERTKREWDREEGAAIGES